MGNKRVPEVRFEGFNGDWEERKFSNIVGRVSKQSNDATLPKVEFEDIVSGEGRLNKDILKKFDARKGIVFEPNFILFGKLRPYLKNWLLPNFKGIALGDFWVFEPKNSYSIFNYYLIQTDKYQIVANLSSGTKMPRSDWKTVSETEFRIPSIEEQTKIGNFFKQLDDTIALHQQELTTLKQTKQGFLQKMFPKEGESVPEVRFPGFTGDWEECKFGDIYDVISGFAFKMSDYVQVGVPIINGESIQHGSISTNNLNYLPEEFSEKYQNVTLETGDIVLGLNRPITNGNLKIAQVPTDLNGALLYQRAGKIIILNKTDINLSFQLLGKEISKFVLKEAVGSDQPFISTTNLKKWLIRIPIIEQEQKRIGLFFKQLDDTIALHQREVDALKETKKAFLQKMFV
ncbi:restriction endonuclease subunit S [Bacillus spizizenii]|nr:restriction endonuclease subunit S [Bacillus spizizenii]MCY7958609.1 restriction endonuclease subunit S [Bacillus spizizenii]MCY7989158.1 restriction endonuclease subunit S [Bacillus spizizenii]MCY7996288.1 restriction endonuclease subunit S [Bacillus spizizenii]MCY8049666.1 restriction endonuclease subunit S [Bacillus spizizenii]